MREQNHPIWALLNLIVLLSFATIFAWLNASNFDETEMRMLIQIGVALGGWEYAKKRIRKTDDKPEGD